MKRKPQEFGKYLEVHPQVCFGKLIFKGTRVPVATVLTLMSKGRTIDDILESWPYLQREAIAEALHLAGKALVQVCGAAPTDGELEEPAPWEKPGRKASGARIRATR